MVDAAAGDQADHTTIVDQHIGGDGAGVFDHPPLDGIGRLCRQNDQAARRLNRIAVLNVGGHRAWGDQDVGEGIVALELELVGFSCSEHNGAPSGHHHPGVANFRGQQGNVAPQGRGDLALIDNGAGGTISIEAVVSCHEVRIADVGRGR